MALAYRTIHRMISFSDLRKGTEEIEKLIEEPECKFDSALMAYWRLDGPWHYSDEQAAQHPHGPLLVKLRDRLLNDHYAPCDIGYQPAHANKLSLTGVQKLQKAGVDPRILRVGEF